MIEFYLKERDSNDLTQPDEEFKCLRSNVINVEAIVNSNVSNIRLLLNLTKVLRVVHRSLLLFLLCFRSSLGLLLSASCFSFNKLLCLSFLLAFDELTLSPLGISFGWLLLLFLFSTVRIICFGPVGLFIVVLRRGEPADEISEEWPHSVLCLPLEEDTVFVHTKALRMPFDEELILKQAIVVELFAERGSELLHFRVEVDEELADRLEEVLVAIILLLSNQLREDRLKGVPVLHNVAVGTKNTLHGEEHLVLARHIQLELELAHFSEDLIRAASACVGLLLCDEVLQLLTRLNYTRKGNKGD